MNPLKQSGKEDKATLSSLKKPCMSWVSKGFSMLFFLPAINLLHSITVDDSYFQNAFRPDLSEIFPQYFLLHNSSLLASCYCS